MLCASPGKKELKLCAWNMVISVYWKSIQSLKPTFALSISYKLYYIAFSERSGTAQMVQINVSPLEQRAEFRIKDYDGVVQESFGDYHPSAMRPHHCA